MAQQQVLDTILKNEKNYELSIIKLSEPLAGAIKAPGERNSDASVLEIPTPASLEADLTHYKVFVVFFISGADPHAYRNCSPNFASLIWNK